LLDDLGIIATISWFCREFERLYSDIRIEKEINIEEREVPDSLKTVIFRILQEALHNVAKHAKAGLVRVALTKADDGFGLTSMKERAELSGGSFTIESTPGAGTTIRASWQEGGPQ
jgi:signal transduction histidine kinase